MQLEGKRNVLSKNILGIVFFTAELHIAAYCEKAFAGNGIPFRTRPKQANHKSLPGIQYLLVPVNLGVISREEIKYNVTCCIVSNYNVFCCDIN